jgi:hypothetical protein
VDGPHGTKVGPAIAKVRLVTTTPPFQLKAKILPNGTHDDGEYLVVDTSRLRAATSTATVRILVVA